MKIGDLIGVKAEGNLVYEAIITDLNYKGGRNKDNIRVYLLLDREYREVSPVQVTSTPPAINMIPKSVTPEVLLEYIDKKNPGKWFRELMGRNPIIIREEHRPKWQRSRARRVLRRPLRLRR